MTSSESNHDPLKRKASPTTMLDSLLSEMLNETAMPNFAPRHEEYVARAREGRRQHEHGLFTPEELQAAADLAWGETQFDAEMPPTNNSRVPAASPSLSPIYVATERRFGLESNNQLLLLAIAASVIGVLFTMVVIQRRGESNRIVEAERAFPKLGSGNDNLFPTPAVPNEAIASNISVAPPNVEIATLSPVPAPTPATELPSQLADQAVANPSDNQIASSTPALAPRTENESTTVTSPLTLGHSKDRNTIAVIDEQLQHLWKRVGLSGGKQVDLASLEDRLAQLLVGRLPTSTERAWARKANLGAMETAQLLAVRWIESEEFDRHWAGILSEYYLDQAIEENPSEPRQRFTNWLQESLRTNRSIASMERALLTADSATQPPESYWWTHWTTLGGKNVTKQNSLHAWTPVGYAEDAKASLESVSLQVLRLTGQSEASCARCHTNNPASLISAADHGNAGSLPQTFQGTAALVASLLDPQKTIMYAADPEGKVSLVDPKFPDGSAVVANSDRRQALGVWVEASERARAPFVNFVWYRILGQPLLPKICLTADEGLDERRDLLEFLARQSQTANASVRQLVFWVAMSAPVTLEASELDAATFLKMDEKALAEYQRTKRLFARFSGAPRTTSSTSRFGNLAQWLVPAPKALAENGLLAQPSAGKGSIDSLSLKQESLALNPSSWSADRVGFEASDAVPYARARDFATAFATSTMDWDAVVDHSFLMCVSRYPSSEERKQAADLLEWSKGDRQLASTRLINALLGQL